MKLYDTLSNLNAFRVAAIYGTASVLWIIFSDRILGYLVENPELVAQYQTMKGLVFVSLSTLLVYLLVRASRSKIKDALREKEVLLSEIHHRVKNNLAVISGLIQLQAFQEDHPKTSETLLKSVRRVGSIALVHEMVYQTDSLTNIRFDELVPDLVALTVQHFDLPEERRELTTEPVSMNVNQAVSCALFMNEALSFIYQQVIAGSPDSTLEVSIDKHNDTLTFSITANPETGAGEFAVGRGEAMELELLELITRQLDGTLSVQDENGLGIVLTFDGSRNPKGAAANVAVSV